MLLAFSAARAAAQEAGGQHNRRKVLIIYSYAEGTPWQDTLARSLLKCIAALAPDDRPELFQEELDSARLGDSVSNDIESAALGLKYRSVRLDAVMTESQQAAVFLAQRPALFRGTPRYYFNFSPTPPIMDKLRDARYFTPPGGIRKAVETILAVRPATRRIIVVMDRTELGRARADEIRGFQKSLDPAVSLAIWDDFTVDELCARAARLPASSALLFLPVVSDRLGRPVRPRDVVRSLAASASVPVFSHFDTLLGTGIVGGYLVSAGQLGNLMGMIAAYGEKAVPPTQEEFSRAVTGFYFDAQQLQRWKISERRLPAASMVVNRPDNLWTRYGVYIAGVAFAFLLETALILLLVHYVRLSRRSIKLLARERDELEERVAVRTNELRIANDHLEKLLSVDSLTGIANRRRFDEYLEGALRRARRSEKPLSLVLADIDFFKRCNDVSGHLVGDQILRDVAGCLSGIVSRPDDLTARYGGEELAFILPDTDLEGAWHIAESARVAVENLRIGHPDSPLSPFVTISLGVASLLPSLASTVEELIGRADTALYSAKANGRNCTVRSAQA